jgi:hypothetical protein
MSTTVTVTVIVTLCQLLAVQPGFSGLSAEQNQAQAASNQSYCSSNGCVGITYPELGNLQWDCDALLPALHSM